jgi:hypothetical protein
MRWKGKKSEPRARVKRDGKWVTPAARELVPGSYGGTR